MKRFLLLLAVLGAVAFTSCEKAPISLVGTTWTSYADGEVHSFYFETENVMYYEVDGYSEGRYMYVYDKPHITFSGEDGITLRAKIKGNVMTLTTYDGGTRILVRE